MSTHGRPARNQFFHDFPGVFAAKIILAGWAVFWPWISLHGAARVATGIPWTGAALLVAGLIARERLGGHKR
jgi:hypothetical protein